MARGASESTCSTAVPGAAGRGGLASPRGRAARRWARASLGMCSPTDTLESLRKGGRIGSAQAFLGSALEIKPILTLEEEITPVERVRTRRRAFERMVQFPRECKE